MRLGISGTVLPDDLRALTPEIAQTIKAWGYTGVFTRFRANHPLRTSPDDCRRVRDLLAEHQLDHVMDIEKQGHAVIEESRALLRWLHEQGYARVGVAGISFGGAMAALTGRNMPFPLAVCSFVGSHSPEPAYLDGVMSRSVNMDALTSPKHGHIAASAILRHFLASFDVRDVPVSGVPAAFVQINAIHDRFLHASSAAVLHSAFAQHAHFRTRMYWIAGGHLTAIVLHSGVFIKGIIESFDLLDELL